MATALHPSQLIPLQAVRQFMSPHQGGWHARCLGPEECLERSHENTAFGNVYLETGYNPRQHLHD